MGKSLIIKGADFSQNAIFASKWYNEYADDDLDGQKALNASTVVLYPAAIDAMGMRGKVVNTIRLYSYKAVSISIGSCQASGERDGEYSVTFNDDATLYSLNVGINDIHLETPITLSEGTSLGFKGVGTENKEILAVNVHAGSSTESDEYGWTCGYGNAWNGIGIRVPIMFGYFTEDNQ